MLRLGLRVGLIGGLGALTASGCTADGTGQIEGSLFLRGCPSYDPTPGGSTAVPSPLPAFALDPVAFFGQVSRQLISGDPYEVTSIDRINIRLQRGTEKPDRTDVFELWVLDLDRALRDQEAALQRGERGFPILPPPIDQSTAPLPGDPYAFARAALQLHSTCRNALVQPQFRGYVRFYELGRNLGEFVEAEVGLAIEDARATREQGGMPTSVNTAGTLSGRFRFELRTGPAVFTL